MCFVQVKLIDGTFLIRCVRFKRLDISMFSVKPNGKLN